MEINLLASGRTGQEQTRIYRFILLQTPRLQQYQRNSHLFQEGNAKQWTRCRLRPAPTEARFSLPVAKF